MVTARTLMNIFGFIQEIIHLGDEIILIDTVANQISLNNFLVAMFFTSVLLTAFVSIARAGKNSVAVK